MKNLVVKRSVLEKLMADFNIGDNELSEKTGVPPTTIYRLKIGKTIDPRLSTITELAHFFKVTLGQLIGEEPLSPDFDSNTKNNKATFLKIPILTWDQAFESAQILPTLSEKNHFSWTYVDIAPSKNIFALKINSEEYSHTFPKNMLLFVDTVIPEKYPFYAIVSENTSQKSVIFKVIKGIPDYLVHPENASITFPFDEKRYNIIGAISGTQIIFNSNTHLPICATSAAGFSSAGKYSGPC